MNREKLSMEINVTNRPWWCYAFLIYMMILYTNVNCAAAFEENEGQCCFGAIKRLIIEQTSLGELTCRFAPSSGLTEYTAV